MRYLKNIFTDLILSRKILSWIILFRLIKFNTYQQVFSTHSSCCSSVNSDPSIGTHLPPGSWLFFSFYKSLNTILQIVTSHLLIFLVCLWLKELVCVEVQDNRWDCGPAVRPAEGPGGCLLRNSGLSTSGGASKIKGTVASDFSAIFYFTKQICLWAWFRNFHDLKFF